MPNSTICTRTQACSSVSIRSSGRSTWGAASTTTGTRRSTCSSAGPSEKLQAAAFGQVLDLVEHERGLVAAARVLMAAAHLRERRITFGGSGIPMDAVPLGAQDLAEGVSRRKAEAHAIGPLLLDHRRPEVRWLADTHSGGKLKVGGRRGARRPKA